MDISVLKGARHSIFFLINAHSYIYIPCYKSGPGLLAEELLSHSCCLIVSSLLSHSRYVNTTGTGIICLIELISLENSSQTAWYAIVVDINLIGSNTDLDLLLGKCSFFIFVQIKSLKTTKKHRGLTTWCHPQLARPPAVRHAGAEDRRRRASRVHRLLPREAAAQLRALVVGDPAR